jgi:hypothetical protein
VWYRVYLYDLHLLGLNRTENVCLCRFPVWKVKRSTVNSLTAVSVSYSIFFFFAKAHGCQAVLRGRVLYW